MWHAYAISPAVAVLAAALAGLAAGLALLRVIDRLPLHVRRDWRAQCSELYGEPLPMPPLPAPAARPVRAALVAGLAALAFAACAWRYGATPMAVAAMGFCAALLALAWMDAETGLLADVVTLPLMWAGLLVNLHGALVPLPQAVLGAVLGYLALWVLFHAYRLATGRIGMGYGDFKLVAAIGAWLGVGALPSVLVVSSLLGVAAGLLLRAAGRASPGQGLPFGPWLAAGAALMLLAGDYA